MPTVLELETLVTRLTGDVGPLLSSLRSAETAFQRTAANFQANGDSIQAVISGIGRVAFSTLAPILGLSGALTTLIKSIELAATTERLEKGFANILGSVEEAEKILNRIKELSFKTPFRNDELVIAARELSIYGFESKNLIGTLETLSAVAAGSGSSLQRLVELYGLVIDENRVFTRDVRAFERAGVPLYLELAKTLGLVDRTTKHLNQAQFLQLRKTLEPTGPTQGIPVEALTQAFKNLAIPGGIFHGALKSQTEDILGLFTKMRDQITFTMKEIGNVLTEGLDISGFLRNVADIANQFTGWLKGLSKETREVIAVVLGVVSAFLALAAAITIAGIVFNFFFGGIGIWVGLLALVTAGTTVWVQRMNGLEEAWIKVKRAANDFWDFIKPILPAIAVGIGLMNPALFAGIAVLYLLITNWKAVQTAVEEFYDFARPILQALWSFIKVIAFTIRDAIGSAIVSLGKTLNDLGLNVQFLIDLISKGNWKKVQEDIRDFILQSEYAWKHFDLAAQVAIWNTVLTLTYLFNLIKHGFTVNFVEAIQMLPTYFKNIFTTLLVIGYDFVQALIKMLTGGLLALPDIIAGKEGAKEALGKLLADTFSNFTKTVDTRIKGTELPAPKFSEAPTSEAEKQVGKILKVYQDMYDKGFKQFKAEKLLEFAFEDAFEQLSYTLRKIVFPLMFAYAGEEGGKAGTVYANAFMLPFKKVEATLFHGAEAISRVAEYQLGLPQQEFIDRTRTYSPTNINVEVAPMPHDPQLQIIDILKQIDMHIVESAQRVNSAGGLGGLGFIASNLTK